MPLKTPLKKAIGRYQLLAVSTARFMQGMHKGTIVPHTAYCVCVAVRGAAIHFSISILQSVSTRYHHTTNHMQHATTVLCVIQRVSSRAENISSSP
jgi:hypothetical protein